MNKLFAFFLYLLPLAMVFEAFQMWLLLNVTELEWYSPFGSDGKIGPGIVQISMVISILIAQWLIGFAKIKKRKKLLVVIGLPLLLISTTLVIVFWQLLNHSDQRRDLLLATYGEKVDLCLSLKPGLHRSLVEPKMARLLGKPTTGFYLKDAKAKNGAKELGWCTFNCQNIKFERDIVSDIICFDGRSYGMNSR